MAKFFSSDGAFNRVGSLVFDIIMLSFLGSIVSGIVPAIVIYYSGWFVDLQALGLILLILCFLLLGPCHSALVYTFSKRQRGEETYTLRDFFHGYKINFKHSLLIGLITEAVFAFMLYNLYLIGNNFELFGVTAYVLYPLEIFIGIEAVNVFIYGTGLVARFEMSLREYLKYAFLMASKHIFTSLILLAATAAYLYLCFAVSFFFLLVIPALYAYLDAALLEKVFRHYMPTDEEEMLEEDTDTGLVLDAERQAIIDRYLGNAHYDENASVDIVRVDDDGNLIPTSEDDYQIVVVDDGENNNN